jgi:hypothetical protein
MRPITHFISDPTIERYCKLYGSNWQAIAHHKRLVLIAALALSEWPDDAPTGGVHFLWVELQYLDMPARCRLIQGVCEGIIESIAS